MSGAVVVRRCASAEEAVIVCAVLNDAGIPASLENWHHAMIDWGALQALGGVGVRVPAGQLEAAREAIIGYAESAEERLREDFPELDAYPLSMDRRRGMRLLLVVVQTGFVSALILPAAVLLEVLAASAKQPFFRWRYVLPEGPEYDIAGWLFGSTIGTLFAVPIILAYLVFVHLTQRFLARRAALKALS